jgi:hypothetical protein
MLNLSLFAASFVVFLKKGGFWNFIPKSCLILFFVALRLRKSWGSPWVVRSVEKLLFCKKHEAKAELQRARCFIWGALVSPNGSVC